MLLFKVSDTCPSGKAFQEGPAVDCEADASQDGYTGGLQDSREWEEASQCVRGERKEELGWLGELVQ